MALTTCETAFGSKKKLFVAITAIKLCPLQYQSNINSRRALEFCSLFLKTLLFDIVTISMILIFRTKNLPICQLPRDCSVGDSIYIVGPTFFTVPSTSRSSYWATTNRPSPPAGPARLSNTAKVDKQCYIYK